MDASYVIGGVLAVVLRGYLVYSIDKGGRPLVTLRSVVYVFSLPWLRFGFHSWVWSRFYALQHLQAHLQINPQASERHAGLELQHDGELRHQYQPLGASQEIARIE